MGGRWRHRLGYAVAAALAVAVCGVCAVALQWRPLSSGVDGEPACRPAALSAAAPGDLAVVEQGFTLGDDGTLSIGAILGNHGKQQVAYRTRVTFRVVRIDGTPVLSPDPFQEIPVVLPGRRVAVGAAVHVPAADRAAVSGVVFDLSATRWVAYDTRNPLLRPPVTSLVGRLSDPARPAEISFLIDDSGCRDAGLAERGVGMAFRDAGDAIVGGGLALGAGEGSCSGAGGGYGVPALHLPATADPARSEVSVYCDVPGSQRAS
ncbi:hypothetical protein [Dactylosporangium sp. CA-139066]|uniref:hypothetical protein n=1 Tax=Dactylosporangium sp. CA-139066 TaxID=3239930 RepID=UPI003D8D2C11